MPATFFPSGKNRSRDPAFRVKFILCPAGSDFFYFYFFQISFYALPVRIFLFLFFTKFVLADVISLFILIRSYNILLRHPSFHWIFSLFFSSPFLSSFPAILPVCPSILLFHKIVPPMLFLCLSSPLYHFVLSLKFDFIFLFQ